MPPPHLLLTLLFTTAPGHAQSQGSSPAVDLGYAQYKGSYNATSQIKSWFGIRYAQAPVGELRWQPPVEIESMSDNNPSQTIDASEPEPSCVQGFPAWFGEQRKPTGTETEDCLLLDVIAPAEPASSRLPVMVSIHGGGYTVGSSQPPRTGDDKLFALSSSPGNALVYQSHGNLIYVTIQYRLGAYGFLGASEVLTNGAANAGLLDQRAALMWVQRHIDKFGGDPSMVTIIGGSAGGGSVVNQMIMYGGVSNPPFRAAIAEYPWMQPYHNSTTLEKQYDALRNGSGCHDLQCLRQLSATDLCSAADKAYLTGYEAGDYGYGDFFFGPYVDGSIIRNLPSNELKLGRFTKVPLLTNREGYEGVASTNLPYAKTSFFSRLLQLYSRSDFNSTFFQRAAMFGDAIISCPSALVSATVSGYGVPVWKFVFYAGSQTHGALLPFVETVDVNGNSNNATLASILRDYYISFAASFDPNARDFTSIERPYWPEYQDQGIAGTTVLNISYTTIETSSDLDVRPQCDFFSAQGHVVRN